MQQPAFGSSDVTRRAPKKRVDVGELDSIRDGAAGAQLSSEFELLTRGRRQPGGERDPRDEEPRTEGVAPPAARLQGRGRLQTGPHRRPPHRALEQLSVKRCRAG